MTREEILDVYRDDAGKRETMLRELDEGRPICSNVRIPDTECCGRAPWDCECPRIDEFCGCPVRGLGRCGACS